MSVYDENQVNTQRTYFGLLGGAVGALITLVACGGLHNYYLQAERDRHAALRACEPNTGERTILSRGHDGRLECRRELLSQHLLGDVYAR